MVWRTRWVTYFFKVAGYLARSKEFDFSEKCKNRKNYSKNVTLRLQTCCYLVVWAIFYLYYIIFYLFGLCFIYSLLDFIYILLRFIYVGYILLYFIIFYYHLLMFGLF